jgi:hypothetical protein
MNIIKMNSNKMRLIKRRGEIIINCADLSNIVSMVLKAFTNKLAYFGPTPSFKKNNNSKYFFSLSQLSDFD